MFVPYGWYPGWSGSAEEEVTPVRACVRTVQQALFYTCEWKIQLLIDDSLAFESAGCPSQPDGDDVRRWVESLIALCFDALKRHRIDVFELYRSVGGDPFQLLVP